MVQPLYQGAPTTGFGGAGFQLDQDNDFVNLGVFSLSTGEGGTATQAGAFQIRCKEDIFYRGHDEAQIAQRCGRYLIPGKIQVQVAQGSGQSSVVEAVG